MASCEPDATEPSAAGLSAAQRARIERNRLHARALHEARLVTRSQSNTSEGAKQIYVGKRRAIDTGGGFLTEAESAEGSVGSRAVPGARPAPLVHASQQPRCKECQQLFPQSYLFDTFDFSVCDDCRDDEGAHELVTRTEAKSEFLLKDCDLDSRPPPLRCVRRRNPHRTHYAEMRLYLRAQVEERALLVWGSEERLLQERAAREERRERAQATAARRRLTALRMAVRSSLYDGTHVQHEHRYGEESYDAETEQYTRACLDCGHTQTYEKM
ncbi:DNA repair protein complementing XP-A cells homolog isoform X2 [Papilio machaon]|uniref:DNA repair protein complementing XP-A cells homolog isoform X2 n=1 Tax=Papilio machaon TaxID=76193 RepID=UPI001E663BE1|nr:DNA repair protein complementing XP-A cells homolog isoform X2 [Papilio machaon]